MKRRRVLIKTVTPPIVARWLEVKDETVLRWIHSKDLPALNIGTRAKNSYLIFRKDLAVFLNRRGMTEDRIREMLG